MSADSTGFPVKGGTMPVTKFGKYDDTTLFKGGGTAAAAIKNPGEFTILKNPRSGTAWVLCGRHRSPQNGP